jgi:heat-inducible transcriptional repressor
VLKAFEENDGMEIELSNRAKAVLFTIITDFIRTGDPVGSRTISKRGALDVSPATIRNIMADLEEIGLLVQPHTSAGRVPTERAYRFYVDSLVKVSDLTLDEERMIEKNLNPPTRELKDVVRETSRVLSEMSRCVSMVSTPGFSETRFKYIDFVKLSENRILAILVSKTGMIFNKLIPVEDEFNQEKLAWMSRYLNDVLSDLTLKEVRRKIIHEMQSEKNLYDNILIHALRMSRNVFETEIGDDELFIEGSTYIFDYPEFTDITRMKEIFKTFENKSNLIKLLDKVTRAEGVKVYIGSETKIQTMRGCTLVASPYRKEGNILGSIGVIGPTRIDYAKVIPIVDFTAHLITRLLDEE